MEFKYHVSHSYGWTALSGAIVVGRFYLIQMWVVWFLHVTVWIVLITYMKLSFNGISTHHYTCMVYSWSMYLL